MQSTVIALETDIPMSATQVSAAPEPSTARKVPGGYRFAVLALLSGAMLWLCHFPVSWGWLVWIALVPMLPLVRADIRARWRYCCAWVAGTVYFWPALSWMTVADSRMIGGWALLALYCSLYFPLAIFLVRRLERGTPLPLVLTLPVVWTALEFFRSWFGTGFSWYLLAHTQHDALQVIQIADLGGAFAVTFLIVAVNAAIFETLSRMPWLQLRMLDPSPGRTCRLMTQLVAVAFLMAATLAYGDWQLSHAHFEKGPRIAVLQGNIDQRLRIDADLTESGKTKVRAIYGNLCRQASELEPRPDLIVWPETSSPHPWITVGPTVDLAAQSSDFRNELALDQNIVLYFGLASRTNVLLGLNTEVLDVGKRQRFNSALLVDARGEPVRRYDKIHRVLFGEYVPFRDSLPFMNTFSPYDFDYSIGQGDGLTRFELGNYRFGVLVCYEDTDQFMARDYGIHSKDGPAVDFLLNLSNDGWFAGSSEHEEHLAISRFRAIETRRALARSVNMGISAVIDGNGRVLAIEKLLSSKAGQTEIWTASSEGSLSIGDWRGFKKAEGILVVEMPIDHRTSLYALCGDWLPNVCWLTIGVGLTWSWRRRRAQSPPPHSQFSEDH